jgi:hypothetical protein
MSTSAPHQQLASYLAAQKSSRTTALLLFALILGPPSLIGGSILYAIARTLNRASLWVLLALALLLSVGYAAWHWQDLVAAGLALYESCKPLYTALQQAMRQSRGSVDSAPPIAWLELLLGVARRIWAFWQWGLLGIPLIALYLNGTRLKTAEEQERQREQRQAHALHVQSRAAATASRTAPPQIDRTLVLGAAVEGDLEWTRGRWLLYPPDVLGRHLVLIGASGMGKSETALRLAAGAANVYDWQVFFLDAKGDQAMAERFWAAMHAAGRRRIAMLPQRPVDGWRGDATALLNRLLSVLEFSEPFYRDLTKMVLSLAVDAPEGPPRSSTELLRRLHLPTLKSLYLAHPDGRELAGLQGEQVAATYNRYRAFFRALRGSLDGDWAWEDVEAGYFLLDGLALKDQAVSLGRYLLEDFAHYVSVRKDPRRRVLLIVDEFSALAIGGTDAASLFERVRSCGASVMVTSQSYAGLGAGADRILGAAAAVLLHQCPDPETLIARAGTARDLQQRVMGTERFGLGGIKTYATGQVAFQEREVVKVRPEAVQQLEAGEGVLIVGGKYRRVRVSQLDLPEVVLAAAQRAMHAQPWRVQRPRLAAAMQDHSQHNPQSPAERRISESAEATPAAPNEATGSGPAVVSPGLAQTSTPQTPNEDG